MPRQCSWQIFKAGNLETAAKWQAAVEFHLTYYFWKGKHREDGVRRVCVKNSAIHHAAQGKNYAEKLGSSFKIWISTSSDVPHPSHFSRDHKNVCACKPQSHLPPFALWLGPTLLWYFVCQLGKSVPCVPGTRCYWSSSPADARCLSGWRVLDGSSEVQNTTFDKTLNNKRKLNNKSP